MVFDILTRTIVSIGDAEALDSFCAVKEGKHSRHYNAIFEARVLQILASCEYFPYVFGVFDRKLVYMQGKENDNSFKHAEGN